MRIALVGSAPSSARLAPYADESWKIWGCSPGLYPVAERVDVWYELHRWEPPLIGDPTRQVPWFSPEYVEWLKQLHQHDVPVYMTEVVPEVPSSTRYPRERVIAEFGPHFLTSSLALMLALAILEIEDARAARRTSGTTADFDRTFAEDKQDAIGLWGVDMAANEEYAYQRPGCQHFIYEAKRRGIEVILPPESDLMRAAPIYGLSEWSHAQVKALARRRELEGRIAAATQRRDQAQQEILFLQGALDNLDYMQKTWIPSEPDMTASDCLKV